MPNPVPDLAALQAFSGVTVSENYTDHAYASNALQMAADILEFVVGDIDPADDREARLLNNATCEMAQALYLEQPYKVVLASPFASESIGNYHYQKTQGTAPTVGIPKGVTGAGATSSWFDMAVRHFGISEIAENSSTRVFEDDMIWLQLGGGDAGTDKRLLMGPSDIDPTMYGPVFRNSGEFDSSGFAINRRGAD